MGEARMWCVIRHLRDTEETDSLQSHSWCLEFQSNLALHHGEPHMELPTKLGSRKKVSLEAYVTRLQSSMREHLREVVKISGGKASKIGYAAYAGLSASLERCGQIEQAREVGEEGKKQGIWSSQLQRPAHVCGNLLPGQYWHDSGAMQICG